MRLSAACSGVSFPLVTACAIAVFLRPTVFDSSVSTALLTAAMLYFYSRGGQLHPNQPRFILMDEAYSKAPIHAREGLTAILNLGLQPIVITPVGNPAVEEVVGQTKHVSHDLATGITWINDIPRQPLKLTRPSADNAG